MHDKQLRKIFQGIICLILLVFILYRLGDIFGIFTNIISIIKPFLIGAAIAFILSIPMNFLERKFPKLKRPLSLLLTFLIFILVILILIFLVGPKLIDTITNIVDTVPQAVESLRTLLQKSNINWKWVQDYLTNVEIDWPTISNKLLSFFKDSFGNLFTSTFGVVASLVSSIVSTVISFIFAAYILISKEKLSVQLKKLMYAFLPEKAVDKIIEVGKLTHKTFSNFFTYQCIECLILGFMFLVTMTILKIPYALLISVLITIMALIPIFGLCIAFIIASILIVMVDPIKVIVFAILFAVLQQIEGNLIYPRVVGKSIGLPPIWVIVVITLGSSLMGVVGMILFIPLSSVIYTLIRKSVYKRLRNRQISNDKWL
ncbi:AI-2E family transporter [Intestinibacter sp.]|uniref:AI-2E family transporter n=1 Tax=Intestinibacter sp. TaxID=1965304 RepID=UPI002A90D85C|nr:AI-2E family transporter [Intestinibacter sp.]MDY5212019.1 AI-2E family transporter [Intestinibacter sp.]